MDQIRQIDPPPNPAKLSDTRSAGYITQWGRQSWELDAVPPMMLAELVSSEIALRVDHALFREAENREKAGQIWLEGVADEKEKD